VTRGRGERLGAASRLCWKTGRGAHGLGWRWWWAAVKAWEGVGFLSLFFPIAITFLKQAYKFEFKPGLNPNTQKQCTGMNATHTTIYLI
jgi:hypothetical protein